MIGGGGSVYKLELSNKPELSRSSIGERSSEAGKPVPVTLEESGCSSSYGRSLREERSRMEGSLLSSREQSGRGTLIELGGTSGSVGEDGVGEAQAGSI
jgi:hypothetical protein